MAEPLERAGGRRLLNTNEKVTADTFRQVGAIAEQSYLNVLAARLFGELSGVVGNDCEPSKGGGDLDWIVEKGLAFVNDATETDVFEPIYKAIPVDAQQTGTATAHDPTNARKDLISIGPSTVAEENVSRQIYDEPMDLFNPSGEDTHTRRTFELTVTAGTPSGSPVLPSTPAGHIQIAELQIPATSGPMTVVDLRTSVTVSQTDLAQVDTADLVDDAVTEPKIDDLAVTEPKIANGAVTANKLARPPIFPDVTAVGAEAANAIAVTMIIRDTDGGTEARDQRLKLTVYDDNGDVDTANAFVTFSSGGDAAVLSANSKGRIFMKAPTTNTSFSVIVTDATGVLSGNLWLEVQPISEDGTINPGEALIQVLAFT